MLLNMPSRVCFMQITKPGKVASQEYYITAFSSNGYHWLLPVRSQLFQNVELLAVGEPNLLHLGWPWTVRRGPNVSTPLYFGAHDILYVANYEMLEEIGHLKAIDVGGIEALQRKIRHLVVGGNLALRGYESLLPFVKLETLILETPQVRLSAATPEHHKAEMMRQQSSMELTVSSLKEKFKMNKKLVIKFWIRWR